MRSAVHNPVRRFGLIAFCAAVLLASAAEAGVRLGGGGVRLGAGVSVGGAGVRLGGGGVRLTPPRPSQPLYYPSSHPACPPYGWGYPCFSWGVSGWPYWWYWGNDTYQGPPLIEIVRRVDPAAAGVEGQPLPPPPDEGLVALWNRDYARAVVVYAQRLADGGGATDRRLMAVSLIGARRFEEGAKAVRAAYTAEPSLAERPLDGGPMVGGTMEWRRLVTSMVGYAHRANTSDAWLSVGVLMQAEGRHDWARKMFARSEDRREREKSREEPGGADPAGAPVDATGE